MAKKTLLVTGGAGFIGSNFVRHMLDKDDVQLTVVDALTYAGNQMALMDKGLIEFNKLDLSKKEEVESFFNTRSFDAIVHFAAETHVDRSIQDAEPFIYSNILGTYHLLEQLKAGKAKKMIQISTDEVYGTLGLNDAPFTERTPLSPNNPYSATKASSDFLARSYFETHNVPVMITRCSNNYGPFQHQEKLIPKIIANALENKPIPIYGTGENIRDWLYVEDHCLAIRTVLEKGKAGEVYNIGSSNEKNNSEIVRTILKALGKSESLITFVTDRKGHDYRYAIGWEKINTELGWSPQYDFNVGIQKTIDWYLQQTSLAKESEGS